MAHELARLVRMCGLLSRSLAFDMLPNCPDLLKSLGVTLPSRVLPLQPGSDVIYVQQQERGLLNARKVPSSMVHEAVFAQYAADSGLMQTLRAAISELTDGMPPNPFPYILSRLKAAAVRYIQGL